MGQGLVIAIVVVLYFTKEFKDLMKLKVQRKRTKEKKGDCSGAFRYQRV